MARRIVITQLEPPLRKKVGDWVEMEYDAELFLDGIRWLRVKDGFSGRGDREDWVADLPVMTFSVTKRKRERWRGHVGDFSRRETAMRNVVKGKYQYIQEKIDVTIDQLVDLHQTQKQVRESFSKALKSSGKTEGES